MLKKLSVLIYSIFITIAVLAAGSLHALASNTTPFSQEKLLYLISHDLLSDEDKSLVAKAETEQLSEIDTRVLYTSLEDRYNNARKYRKKNADSSISARGIGLTMVLVGGCFGVLAFFHNTPPETPTRQQVHTAPTPATSAEKSAPKEVVKMYHGGIQGVLEQANEPKHIESMLTPAQRARGKRRAKWFADHPPQYNNTPEQDLRHAIQEAEAVAWFRNGQPYVGNAPDITNEELDRVLLDMEKDKASNNGRLSW